MHLLVFRHGIAEDVATDGTDFSRQLTEEGIERTKRAAAGLKKIAPIPDVILTSPKIRALQTAEIAGEVFDREPVVTSVLADESVTGVIRMLRQRQEEVVMIVGHEPTLSGVIETLCVESRPHPFVRMKKAGCALVSVELNPRGIGSWGMLEWLLSPKALRKLA